MSRSIMEYQRGIGLIEVLVTLLILSTSLMALAALQTRSLQYNQESYFRSQANIMASDILDRLRLYTVGSSANAALPNMSANSNTDIISWKSNVEKSLPSGVGVVNCVSATRVCTITIAWKELSDYKKGKTADQQTAQQFTYAARL